MKTSSPGCATRDSRQMSIRSSQWSFSTVSSTTQRSYNACCSADPGRRGTGSGPLSRRLQCHLLRARLPAAGPGSLPRDLHLLRGQGPPRLPVLLPALLREVSCGRPPAIPGPAPAVCLRCCTLLRPSKIKEKGPGDPHSIRPLGFTQEVWSMQTWEGRPAPALCLNLFPGPGLLGWCIVC
ncbi:transmembrane protein 134 isoform X3 [Nannospalax galili]|uniref:transmembrane protein 134 isoform X3 n=1 Tax=Nannospalax galili TaxID=1026970 RepID=UPI00111BD552|nr:transmembrane protein 134 isoform X3 [Nannospalax galili]